MAVAGQSYFLPTNMWYALQDHHHHHHLAAVKEIGLVM
jgi:hypothetical protein